MPPEGPRTVPASGPVRDSQGMRRPSPPRGWCASNRRGWGSLSTGTALDNHEGWPGSVEVGSCWCELFALSGRAGARRSGRCTAALWWGFRVAQGLPRAAMGEGRSGRAASWDSAAT